jgi:hypothetical protein
VVPKIEAIAEKVEVNAFREWELSSYNNDDSTLIGVTKCEGTFQPRE